MLVALLLFQIFLVRRTSGDALDAASGEGVEERGWGRDFCGGDGEGLGEAFVDVGGSAGVEVHRLAEMERGYVAGVKGLAVVLPTTFPSLGLHNLLSSQLGRRRQRVGLHERREFSDIVGQVLKLDDQSR